LAGETELLGENLLQCYFVQLIIDNWITKMETAAFSMWSVPRSCLEDNSGDPVRVYRVKAGSNTSTVALRVVGDEKGTQCLGV
jgi:hypothetical protein